MKIYDEITGAELSAPDLGAGYLYTERRFVAHHEATEAATHLEIMPGTEALNDGAGLRQIMVDAPACPAWDEYEDVQIYHTYTEAELAAMQPSETETPAAGETGTDVWAEMAAAYNEGVNEA